MAIGLKTLVSGGMALAAASLAGVSFYVVQPEDDSQQAAAATAVDIAESDASICLKSDIALWEGVESGCLSPSQIAALWDKPVMMRGEPAAVELTHPSDHSVKPVECRTCRQYAERQWDGWFAMTSRDMRREAAFVYACGALSLIEQAAPARESYFEDGSPGLEDMQALAPILLLRLTNSAAFETVDVDVERIGDAEWRLAATDNIGSAREIANADFTGDGVEDVLIFLYGAPVGGSAVLSSVAILEKPSEAADVSVTFHEFRDGQQKI